MSSPRLLAAALVAPLALAAPLARADGFSVDRYRATPAGDAFFAVESAASQPLEGGDGAGEGNLRAAVVFDYANAPVVLRQAAGSGLELGKPVSYQAFAHADAAFDVSDRVIAWVDAPFVVASSGQAGAASLLGMHEPSGSALGDVRLGARVRLLGAKDGAFQLALSDAIALPTGDPQQLAGDGRLAFEESLVAGGLVDQQRGLWGASLGARLRPDHAIGDRRVGNEVTFGAAYALFAARRRVSFGLETFGAVGVGSGSRGVALEALVDARVHLSPWFVGVAAGPGLTSAVGTPSYRLLLTAGWAAF